MNEHIQRILEERLVSMEKAYERKIAELSLLKELGGAFKKTSLSQWSELFLRQLDIIKQHTGIYSVSVMLVDENTQSLFVVSASAMKAKQGRKPISLKKGEGIAGKVFEAAETLYIPDVTRDPNFSDRGTRQTGSLVCVPIVSEGICTGVLNFRDNVPDALGRDDLRFFDLIADQLSITASLVKTYQSLMEMEGKRINLSRYFSRGLAEHLVADERMTQLGGEKRMVAAMFADITGFTSKVESHSVEEVVEVLNRYFETVVPLIFKYGGMLDKFLGDGIMAVFGIPNSQDRDPLSAVECAIDIQKGMNALNLSLKKDGLFVIDVGIGIASGIVLAGNIGTREHMNYTVIGDPVNLAQRLEALSLSGQIVVSGICAELVQVQAHERISFDPVGEVSIKGITRDVSPMRVVFQAAVR